MRYPCCPHCAEDDGHADAIDEDGMHDTSCPTCDYDAHFKALEWGASVLDNLAAALNEMATKYQPLDCAEPGEPFRIAARMAQVDAQSIRDHALGREIS